MAVESFKQFVDEVLNNAQRRKLAMRMKKNKAKIAIARKKAERKMADMDTLKKRARRAARNQMADKLAKGKSKDELSIAQKKNIEKRLDNPAMQKKIDRGAKKQLKVVRKAEIQRKRNRGQK